MACRSVHPVSASSTRSVAVVERCSKALYYRLNPRGLDGQVTKVRIACSLGPDLDGETATTAISRGPLSAAAASTLNRIPVDEATSRPPAE